MLISDGSSDVCSSDLGYALCRISPVILDAMRSEGLFCTLQPRRFGGGQADIAAFFDKQIEISATDMSTGSLAGVMGVLACHLTLFPLKPQTEVADAYTGRSEERR